MSGCVKIAWVGTEFDTVLSPAVPGPAPPVAAVGLEAVAPDQRALRSTLGAAPGHWQHISNNFLTTLALGKR